MPRTTTSEITSQLLGQAIRKTRREAGMTQADVAKRLHTSTPYISRFENGKTNLTVGQLAAIADALDAELRIELVASNVGREPEIPALG